MPLKRWSACHPPIGVAKRDPWKIAAHWGKNRADVCCTCPLRHGAQALWLIVGLSPMMSQPRRKSGSGVFCRQAWVIYAPHPKSILQFKHPNRRPSNSGTNGANDVACAPPLPTVNAMYCFPLAM